MPIDINLDRRLRVTWCKYQLMLADMNNRYYRTTCIKESIAEGKCDSRWDAEQMIKQEIQEIERNRRVEMNAIYKQAKAEKKAKEEAEQQSLEEERQRKAEKRRVMNEKRKADKINTPITPRRSARLQNKETNR